MKSKKLVSFLLVLVIITLMASSSFAYYYYCDHCLDYTRWEKQCYGTQLGLDGPFDCYRGDGCTSFWAYVYGNDEWCTLCQ